LCTFHSPMHQVEARLAVLELIGQQLRNVFEADLDEPTAGPIAETLRRIAEREQAQRPVVPDD
jgi:hypothetical protein